MKTVENSREVSRSHNIIGRCNKGLKIEDEACEVSLTGLPEAVGNRVGNRGWNV